MTIPEETDDKPFAERFPHTQILHLNEREIYLVGTAHVSRESADEVENLIREVKPDTVAVELCGPRYDSIMNPTRWENTNIVQVIREKKVFLLLSNLILAAFQKRIADRMDVRPGEEMLRAIQTAKEEEAEIFLADREVRITLSRIWRKMGFWAKFKLIAQLLATGFEADEIEAEEIEKLKNQDALASLMEELAGAHPILQEVLIDERDRYLVEKIRNAPGKRIVAVVGAGHVPGMLKYQETPIDLAPLEELPPPGKLLPFLKWGIPTLIILLFIAGFYWGGKDTGVDMILYWVLVKSTCAGIGAICALSHPLAVLSGMVAAPITSLNPMVAAGWVAGLVEAILRKPKVSDMQRISEDITKIKGFWTNKAIRILLVVVFTNLGSSIGTFVALPVIIRLLGQGA